MSSVEFIFLSMSNVDFKGTTGGLRCTIPVPVEECWLLYF